MIQTIELKDLSCGACAATIRTALDIAGFTSVKINLLTTPHWVQAEIEDDSRLEVAKTVLRDHGYPLIDDEVDLPDHTNLNFS